MSIAESCLTLCHPMDCSQPDSSVHGILQARILQWVAISFSRGIFPTQEPNPGILHCKQILYHLSLWGSPKPHYPAHCNKLACQLTHPPAPRLLSVPPMTTGRDYTRTEKEYCLSSRPNHTSVLRLVVNIPPATSSSPILPQLSYINGISSQSWLRS